MTVVESYDLSSDPTCKFINTEPIVHDQRVTIHHWQLRDLVLQRQEPEFKNELIVPVEQDIFRYNRRTGQRRYLIRGLGFHPACMAIGYGYWAGGGQRGDLTVKDLHSDFQVSITTSPGNTINNGICFSRSGNNDIRLLISNNDCTIRVYSVPSLRLLQTIEFNVAVNHASVSPDGRKMVVVGDDKKVHLFAVRPAGQYELLTTMAAAIDANFSVSWTSDSEKFAVASQDGSVTVWDVRSTEPLCKLGTIGNSITKGAARCVKFTQTRAVDLLAYTEHVSHVHIVDARNFDTKQTIRVGPADQDTPLTGLAFSQDSQSMFVGVDNAILEYKIDSSSRRRFPHGALL